MASTYSTDLGNLIYAGLDAVFNSALKSPKETYYKQCSKQKSVGKKFGWYETVGAMTAGSKIAPGQAVSFDKMEDGAKTTIENERYAKGAECTTEALKWDLYGQLNKTFGAPLINKLVYLKEQAVADIYNDGFTATGADGVAVFSNSHPLQNNVAKLNDNLLTGALTTDNLITANNMFNAIYDQSGEFFDTMATHLLIHPNKKYLALQILQSQLMALELSNTKNTIPDVMGVKIVTNKYLDYNYTTNVSPWFLLDMTIPDAGVILQQEGGTNFKTWYHDETLSYRGIAYEDWGCGACSPGYAMIGSAGS